MFQLRHFAPRHFAALRLPLQEAEELHQYYGSGKKRHTPTVEEVLAKWEWLDSIRKQSANSSVEASVAQVRDIAQIGDYREIEDGEMISLAVAVLELGF